MNITGLESSKGDGERKKKAQAIIQRCAACIFFLAIQPKQNVKRAEKSRFPASINAAFSSNAHQKD